MEWENIFHCEWNEFGQKVLKYYWPNAISYGDITKTDFSIHRGKIDILTGGFPCQPFSAAGKRKGNEDDRHLWPEMLRAIREIQPRWIVGENVLGLLNWNRGMVFHEVQTDLEAAGYIMFPYVLPACSQNAPHRRDRVWIVAHSQSNFSGYGTGNERHEPQEVQEKRFNEPFYASHPNSNGQQRSNSEHEINTSKGREYALNDIEQIDVANTKYEGLEGFDDGETNRFNGSYEINDWNNWPTQSPLCSRNDGVQSELVGITISKHRTESIKAYGNSVVPQIVYEIFKAIEQYELNLHTR